MARVYKAVGQDGEVVALKFVRAELAAGEMFREAVCQGGPDGSGWTIPT